MLFLLEIDDLMAGHLAVAIERYRDDLLSRSSVRCPDSLTDLAARFRDRRGQAGTALAGVGEVPHPALMPLLLTRGQVAELLSVSERQVTRLAAAGDITAVKVNGATRYPMQTVERFVDRLAGAVNVKEIA